MIRSAEELSWTFYGYKTPAGGCDVQEWYASLLPEERDEFSDVMAYLRVLPRHQWGVPKFKVLGHDIVEIRFEVSALHVRRIYRVYGAFWPEGWRGSLTFLIGKNKKVNNDKRGKEEAVRRMKLLRQGEAGIHEFEF